MPRTKKSVSFSPETKPEQLKQEEVKLTQQQIYDNIKEMINAIHKQKKIVQRETTVLKQMNSDLSHYENLLLL